MIFVTVGMQLGFDRLIRAMDALAPDLEEEVIAQTGPGTCAPRNMEHHKQVPASKIEQLFEASRLIVAHAGIGTVLAAQRHAKPLVLLPRRFDLGEHRNDHQMATARQLQGRPGIAIAIEIEELPAAIAQAATLAPATIANSPEQVRLKQVVANFIETGILTPHN